MTFLETLQSRLADAQKRMQAAHDHLQIVQAEYLAATQEHGSWQAALNAETKKGVQQGTVSAAVGTAKAKSIVLGIGAAIEENSSKTEMVCELIHSRATGITPSELWGAVRGQIAHRPYLYSILKRLKDRERVMVRRGKYYPRIASKAEEAKQTVPQ